MDREKAIEVAARGEREVTKYAEHLAVLLHAKHYPEVTQWKPMSGDLPGLLTQIDNMTAGMVRASSPDREALAQGVADANAA